MNKGDCFILDAGREIFVYIGQKSKRTERLKAISAANQIRDQDHAGRAQVHIIGMWKGCADTPNITLSYIWGLYHRKLRNMIKTTVKSKNINKEGIMCLNFIVKFVQLNHFDSIRFRF